MHAPRHSAAAIGWQLRLDICISQASRQVLLKVCAAIYSVFILARRLALIATSKQTDHAECICGHVHSSHTQCIC